MHPINGTFSTFSLLRIFLTIYSFPNFLSGGPIILTRPHMLGAAPEYRTVGGLYPDVDKHQTFADIEPVSNDQHNFCPSRYCTKDNKTASVFLYRWHISILFFCLFSAKSKQCAILHASVSKQKRTRQNTGYPVVGSKRVQMNMFLRPVDQIDMTEKVKVSLFPVIWVDEVRSKYSYDNVVYTLGSEGPFRCIFCITQGIEFNDDMVNLIKSKLVIFLDIIDYLHYFMILGGLCSFLFFSVWYLVHKSSQKNKVWILHIDF